MKYDVAPVPGYHPEIGLLLAALTDSTREWREDVGELPDEWTSHQGRPNGRSIGAMLLHIIEAEAFWFESVVGGQPFPKELEEIGISEIDQYGGSFPNLEPRPLSWYFAEHEKWRARVWEFLKDKDPEDTRMLRNDEFTIRWIVAHVVQHDSWHGGQIAQMAQRLRGLD